MAKRYKRYGAPRRDPRRGWLAPVAVVLCLLILVFLVIGIGRMVLGALNGARGGGGSDPQFAEPAETVTRPPSLSGEDGEAADLGDDPSKNWHYETLTPLTEDGLAAEP